MKPFLKTTDKTSAAPGWQPYGYYQLTFHPFNLSICPKLAEILGTKPGRLELKKLLGMVLPAQRQGLKQYLRTSAPGQLLVPSRFEIFSSTVGTRQLEVNTIYLPQQLSAEGLVAGIVRELDTQIEEQKINLAVVNHELRNPLSVIKLSAQLLQRQTTAAEPTQQQLCSTILRKTSCIVELLDQYLAGALPDPPYSRSTFKTVDLACLIKQTLGEFSMLYPCREIVCRVNSAGLVQGAEQQLAQVMINFLNNAVKFAPQHKPITVTLQESLTQLFVSFADHGSGVPRGLEKQIFERGYKINPDRRKSSSNGLGLYLVKKIITGHGGNTWVQPSVTGGAVFYFSLPKCLPSRTPAVQR